MLSFDGSRFANKEIDKYRRNTDNNILLVQIL